MANSSSLAQAARDRAEERNTSQLEAILDLGREDAVQEDDAFQDAVKEQIHDCGGTAGGG